MNLTFLLRAAGASAILAGGLRIVASFIPYAEGNLTLEALYLVIDLGLLFGLIGFYGVDFPFSGFPGFAGFVMAEAGTALIVGPDGMMGSVDTYQAGALMMTLGLLVWSTGSWKSSRLPTLTRGLWIASALLGIGGALFSLGNVAFLLAGLAFGASFVLGGLYLWRISGSEIAR